MASCEKDLDPSIMSPNEEDIQELELMELASELYPDDFFRLGVRLGFGESKLSHFKHDNPNNIEGALATMLIRWRKNEVGPSAEVRRRLAEALKYVQRRDLAQTVYVNEDVLQSFKDMSLSDQPDGSGRDTDTGKWRLAKTIPLPSDKAEMMKACIALPGERVAVGYRSGGVDIINIKNGHRERILTDLPIRSLAQLSDGTLVVCNDDNKAVKLFTCRIRGRDTAATPIYSVRQSGKHRSISVDSKDNVYLGLRGFKEIEVVDGYTGKLKKTIKTSVDPWSIAVMRSGHIAITDSQRGHDEAITVVSAEGEIISRMLGVKDARQFITVDENDSIYIAIKAMNGRVKMKKYTGVVVEVITEDLESVTKPREWIQLSCFTPTKMVLCDAKSLFVFKKD